MISKTMKTILHALSAGNIEVENSRRLADLKQLDATRIFLKKMDTKVYNGEHVVPIRLYFPTENAMSAGIEEGSTFPVLLFFHGGGWVTESVENYDRVCSRMAQATAHIVVSVEYRLAPEHRFPVPLEDCYAATRALYTNQLIINTDPEEITIVGDSAGGNLAAAVCLLARDRGEFMPRRQILIYPALGNCYTEKSPFRSVQENGSDYLLTAVKWRIILICIKVHRQIEIIHILPQLLKKILKICRKPLSLQLNMTLSVMRERHMERNCGKQEIRWKSIE